MYIITLFFSCVLFRISSESLNCFISLCNTSFVLHPVTVQHVQCVCVCARATGLQHSGAFCTAVLGSTGRPGEQAWQRLTRVVLFRGLPVRQGPRREVSPHIQVGKSRNHSAAREPDSDADPCVCLCYSGEELEFHLKDLRPASDYHVR